MLNHIAVGVTGMLAVLAGAYLNVMLAHTASGADDHAASQSLEQIRTEVSGLPMIEGGSVRNYIVLRLSATVDRNNLPSGDFDPIPYLLDAAYRACYEFSDTKIDRMRPQDLESLAQLTVDKANARLGSKAVIAVNVEQFNLISKDEIRDNLFKSR